MLFHTDCGCVPEEVLRDFDSGRLYDDALEEQIAWHLGHCEPCERRLVALDGASDPLLQLLRNPSPAGNVPHGSSDVAGRTRFRLSVSTRPWLPPREPATALADKPPSEEELPVRIDRYFIIRRLGRGGFGQVFLAKDTEQDRLVAIKVSKAPCVISPHCREMFLREARTAAAFEHPNIVRVYDFRDTDDGQGLVVMEFIEGRTLSELIKSDRVAPSTAARLAADVAEALDYAHQRGVLHRDVKPGNILLDHNNKPYLADFGLAVHLGQQNLPVNELAGTWAYMSPEQLKGDVAKLDGRSDIWSLGAVLYRLLTGHRPFSGAEFEQLQNAVLHDAPTPPRKIEKSIPEALQNICLKCLEKDPFRRYATAGELARALRRLSGAPLRRRRAVIGGLAAATFGAATAAWSASLAYRESRAAVNELPLNPVVWPTTNVNDFYERDQRTGRVVVDCSSFLSCLETHGPRSPHYRMETTADFQLPIGGAGLAVGIHQIRKQPYEARCLIIYVTNNFGEKGSWLNVENCEIGYNAIRKADFVHRLTVVNEMVHPQALPTIRLSVEVDRQRIVNVSVNDQTQRHLLPALQTAQVAPNAHCGIVVLTRIVFHSTLCEEI